MTFELEECDTVINCWTAPPDVYGKAAFQFNTAQPKNPDPCVIVMANTSRCIQEVVKRVAAVRMEDEFKTLQIAIRGGRHSYIGASTVSKGVVVDISRFNYVQQHNGDGVMTVGAGITLVELYYQLWNSAPRRLLFPGGTCPTVGLSGLTLGGGQGVTGRRYGLTTDQVVELEMVNATGDVMIINENSFEDLFWALRGGGNGNYGIVYQFTLKRYEIPSMNADYLIYFHNSSDWHAVIKWWQEFITNSSFENNRDVWTQLTVTPTQLHIGFHVAGSELEPAIVQNIEALTEMPGITPSGYYPGSSFIKCFYTPENYSGSIAFWAGCTTENQCGDTDDLQKCRQLPTDCGGEPFRMNSGYQSGQLSDDGIQTIIDHMLQVEAVTGCQSASIQLDTLGGKINEVPPNATAFPHRRNTVTYQFLSYFFSPCNETAMMEWQDAFYKDMRNYMSPGAYRNYANLNLTFFNEQYFLENLPRLEKINRWYDPDDLFRYSQSIPLSNILPPIPSSSNSKSPPFLLHLPYAIVGILVLILIIVLSCSYSDHPHQE